jgi:hypothetical protein
MTNLQLNDYTISILLGIITAIVIILFYYIESLLYDKKIRSNKFYSINNNDYGASYNSAYKAVEDSYSAARANAYKAVEDSYSDARANAYKAVEDDDARYSDL